MFCRYSIHLAATSTSQKRSLIIYIIPRIRPLQPVVWYLQPLTLYCNVGIWHAQDHLSALTHSCLTDTCCQNVHLVHLHVLVWAPFCIQTADIGQIQYWHQLGSDPCLESQQDALTHSRRLGTWSCKSSTFSIRQLRIKIWQIAIFPQEGVFVQNKLEESITCMSKAKAFSATIFLGSIL